MRINVKALRLQAWRSEQFYVSLFAYAALIGCTEEDGFVIWARNDEQARKLANWWREHA